MQATAPGSELDHLRALPVIIWRVSRPNLIGRETVDSASGPASPVLPGYGRRVGSLGPGLTSDSADAVRAVLRDGLSAGPQV